MLEVGCGTGKLTELLAARGLLVDAVDPGANMVAAARRRLGATDAVTFHIGRFEDVDLPEQAFDGVFSATAFHWIDPAIGWAKAAAHLRPGGLLALLTHRHVHGGDDAAESGFVAVLREHAPDVAADWPPARDLDTVLAGARARHDNASEAWDWLMGERRGLAVPEAAQLFDDVDVAGDVVEIEDTADRVIAQFRTTSLYFRIEPSRRAAFEEADRRLIESHGGTLRASLATLLMTARRTAP